jgi:hypothetical protein
MSNNANQTPAEILITSAVKTVGKRDFLRTVERLFHMGSAKVSKQRNKSVVLEGEQCCARIKGDRTGMKVGRYVLFDSKRCTRPEVSSDSHLCVIHSNHLVKYGVLPLGKFAESLTEEQKKVFGEL